MRCLKTAKGSSVVEFVLVLPWLVASFLAILAVAIWVMEGQWVQYRAYQGARDVGVYEQEEGKLEMETKEFYIQHRVKGLALPIVAHAPVHFALEGEKSDLSSQASPSSEFKKIPLMDNPIGFCGSQGEYSLCDY